MDCALFIISSTLLIPTNCLPGFKKWLPNWLNNGFLSASRQPVKNAPLIRYLSALLDTRACQGQKVRLQHIKGHAGHEGNEGADLLAGVGSGMSAIEERDWETLEKALRANQGSRKREEGGSIEISDIDLEVCHCRSVLFGVVIYKWVSRYTQKAL
jgi:hypothetical protein